MRSGRDMRPTLQSRPSASARARVYETRNEDMSDDEDRGQHHEVVVARVVDADGAEHDALGDTVAGRVEEGAERGDLRRDARDGAVEHVADAGQRAARTPPR